MTISIMEITGKTTKIVVTWIRDYDKGWKENNFIILTNLSISDKSSAVDYVCKVAPEGRVWIDAKLTLTNASLDDAVKYGSNSGIHITDKNDSIIIIK